MTPPHSTHCDDAPRIHPSPNIARTSNALPPSPMHVMRMAGDGRDSADDRCCEAAALKRHRNM